MNTSMKWIVLMLVIASMAALGGFWFAKSLAPINQQQVTRSERTVLYWYDPMNPAQHFDKPGKSPFMDMQLVPRYADEAGTQASSGVHIDSRITQNLGMRLSRVERGSLNSSLDADGTVMFNQRDVSILQSRTNGFVSRVYAHAVGDVINKDQPLVDVVVPEWTSAQAEYLALLKTSDQALISAAHSRLQLLGMPEDLITKLQATQQASTTITIRSPRSGMINSLDVRDGMTLNLGAPLATIYGLQTVWIEVAIPESYAANVGLNETVSAEIVAYPGITFKGKILAVLPETNAETHTLRVRVELHNTRQQLKPGMFARVHLAMGHTQPVLLIPSEAVIRSGTRSVVLVVKEGNVYMPAEIVIGAESNGKTVVISGLQEGQQVVASGQFLIDSEANLNGVLNRMTPRENSETKSGMSSDHSQERSP